MAPKRGDKKVQNGVTYRYGKRNGKFQWIKSNEGLNLVGATTKKLKKIRDQVSSSAKEIYDKAFGTPKEKQNWSGETKTKTPNDKLKTWRVDSTENKKLQEERKSGKDETYSRKTTNNQKKKVVKKKSSSSSSSTKMGSIEKKNRKIHGDKAINKLKIKHK